MEKYTDLAKYAMNDSDHVLKVVEQYENGDVLVQSVAPAPWGEDSLGYTKVSQDWLAEHAVPLAEEKK